MVSLANKILLVEDLMASEMAIVVAEFLEKSPRRILKSVFLRESDRSGDLSKEPELVEGVKIAVSRGGSLVLRLSGRMIFKVLIG